MIGVIMAKIIDIKTELEKEPRIYCSTWQSLQNQPDEYFEGFGMVIGDEGHLFKAKSLTSILTKAINAEYRFGTTGTLDGTQCFDGETLIKVEEGYKRIKEIDTNDWVLTLNEKTRSFEYQRVLNRFNNGISYEMLEVESERGKMIVTPDHLIHTSIGWIKAKYLFEGNQITSLSKIGYSKVLKINKIKYDQEVYDLEVETNHNYFANGHLVHNCHQLVLEGLFGPIYRSITTKKLIDSNHLSQLKINVLLLKYPKEICKQVSELDYEKEMKYIISNDKRNNFISNLALDQKGNTLILFQFVEKHGAVLYEKIKSKAPKERKVFFVSGETDVNIREDIRHQIDSKQEEINFEFGEYKVSVLSFQEVPLSDGSKKRACDITEEDDVSDQWIIENSIK
jgi:hypothetical protein